MNPREKSPTSSYEQFSPFLAAAKLMERTETLLCSLNGVKTPDACEYAFTIYPQQTTDISDLSDEIKLIQDRTASELTEVYVNYGAQQGFDRANFSLYLGFTSDDGEFTAVHHSFRPHDETANLLTQEHLTLFEDDSTVREYAVTAIDSTRIKRFLISLMNKTGELDECKYLFEHIDPNNVTHQPAITALLEQYADHTERRLIYTLESDTGEVEGRIRAVYDGSDILTASVERVLSSDILIGEDGTLQNIEHTIKCTFDTSAGAQLEFAATTTSDNEPIDSRSTPLTDTTASDYEDMLAFISKHID